ncbi:hypothetical protein [Hymenobacter sp. GOD-10R]|uniref:hypothetical protein n=1 Tax=Hymenobacter sp. GOD-10R TaxID=3093922 RepID=UPI002D787962|nr:hypothetical protein [Hymenobacter sp. GOD-10R]WRQ29102.1 hypothetical protein SD425_02345 [Hymenobacter sp. GOD-10R]
MKKLPSLLVLFALLLSSQLFTGCVASYNPYYQPGVVVAPPPVIIRPRPYMYQRPYYGYRNYGHGGGYGYGRGGGYSRGGYGHSGHGRGR